MHTPHAYAYKPDLSLNKQSHYGKRVREFLFILHKNSVPTAQRTQCAFNGLMLCREIIAIYCRNHKEHTHTHTHTNALRAQKTQLFNLKPGINTVNTELQSLD
jgi:hypothetical protein